jgi:hypothetical protein
MISPVPVKESTFGYSDSIPTVKTHERDALNLPLSSAADAYLKNTLEKIDNDLKDGKVDLSSRLSDQLSSLDTLTRDLNIKLLERGESSPTHYRSAGNYA